ncbi:unnamed protein product [Alternaria alternata]
MNSTMTSSLAAGAAVPISRHFNEYDEYKLILPTSMYLVGYACGPMLWGPLSESYGRKGTMAATTFGPILGPLVSGYIAVVSWSWAFWVGAIFAGATWPLFYFFDETYGPTILKRRAHRLRKETGDERIAAPLELEKTDLNHIVTVILTRPREGIHWIVPTLAGILFGMGYLCLFMALLNYLVDAYEVFAASAMAAASLSRSSFGAVLPFAAKPMYRAMGVAWATSLLGFFSLALCVVPFVFIKWGGTMRDRSKFCQYLRQKKMEEEKERESERAKEKERARLMANEVSAETNEIKAKEDV